MLAGRTSFATPVGAVMTPWRELRALTPRDSVVLAMQLMVAHDIRNVPVVREGGGRGGFENSNFRALGRAPA